jgi:hypothetical protein
VEYQEEIVVIGVDTSILVGLEDGFTIELMEPILFDDSIEFFERWIDLIEPDSE